MMRTRYACSTSLFILFWFTKDLKDPQGQDIEFVRTVFPVSDSDDNHDVQFVRMVIPVPDSEDDEGVQLIRAIFPVEDYDDEIQLLGMRLAPLRDERSASPEYLPDEVQEGRWASDITCVHVNRTLDVFK